MKLLTLASVVLFVLGLAACHHEVKDSDGQQTSYDDVRVQNVYIA